MSTVRVNAGVCGFTATIRAHMTDDACALSIESDCDAIGRLAEDLQTVDALQEISFRGDGPLTLRQGWKHCYHPACPVPVGIVKAVEVAAGLALPRDASITVSASDD